MYKYTWDEETGGLVLLSESASFSKEPRPVYYRELDVLGFDKRWKYPRDDSAPLLWAETNNYIYKGRTVARAKGGSLYTAPEIIFLEDPEPHGRSLEPVKLDVMVEKNRDVLETLAQETIKNIYNTYVKYQRKVDVFYVAFSGGKDSVVALDLVQRTLPHDKFIVIFGDTQMEFPDTYTFIQQEKLRCEGQGIKFYVARSNYSPQETWRQFGPPSTVTRWCCGVHKTTPQILFLRKILNKPNFSGMAFVGIRADESLARSKYDYLSLGTKHRGQYGCNVILDWSSAEVFLYIYTHRLSLNESYKKGHRRIGCLICPRAAERNDFMSYYCYRQEAEPLVEIIREAYSKTYAVDKMEQFIEAGGWKARKNGRDISLSVAYSEDYSKGNKTILRFKDPGETWTTWIRTIGVLINDVSPYTIKFQDKLLSFSVKRENEQLVVAIDAETRRTHPNFVKSLKNVFRRAACCIACQECEADCPYGFIKFRNGKVLIDEKCHHCSQCHQVEKGCLLYKSLEQPKGGIVMSGKDVSLNIYSHHAPKIEWIQQFFEFREQFDEKHNLGSQMYAFFKRFLRDARLLEAGKYSSTARIIERIGLDNSQSWGIIYVNISYAPQVYWVVTRLDFNVSYSRELLTSMLIEDGAKETWTGDILSSLGRLTDLPMGSLGLGSVEREKNHVIGLERKPWINPDAKVILYSLYKFAEACGDYYQFTLSNLMDDSIERDGVSPTRLFGLGREEMIRILNGLSVNYPDYISASFTLDMENITLHAEKSSQDVLSLF